MPKGQAERQKWRKKMLGETFDRILTYGTPAFLFIKELWGKTVGHSKVQEKAVKVLAEIFPDGRTRGDELAFYASLVSLSGIDATLKGLFLKKHGELLNPDLTGKTPTQIAKLRHKEKMAKGLVFLIAEDESTCDATCSKKNSSRLANEVWYGIFLGVKNLPDDKSKLQALEERILHFGKNNQERMPLAEVMEKIDPLWGKIDSAADKLGAVISSGTDWVERQYEERIARAHVREIQRKANWWNWLNPRLWLEQFIDLR